MIRDSHGKPVPRSEWGTSDYERAADRYEQRIADLEAQVTRLQAALRELDADYSREVDDETYDDDMMEAALLALQWGDMAPVKGEG